MTLVSILEESFQVYGTSIAVEDGNSSISYKDLLRLADQVRDRLYAFGIRPGDRVGIYLPKSIDAVASILGVLKAGAAYVPVDPLAPPSRNAYIFADCVVKAIILSRSALLQLEPELAMPPVLVLEQTGGGEGLKQALLEANQQAPAPRLANASPGPDDLAYILYTSGSTGKPKGVMLSHRAALGFINWCSETFAPNAQDRFSSHAPFHFDLSIFDLYVPLKHGASLVLIGEELGKDPLRLATFIAQKQLSIWYSAPSILTMLTQFGKLEHHDYSKLRMVLFAGEVFPIKHLRALKSLLPQPRYFNLYGPTETNVCTYYELPASIPESQHKPFPIGKACSHYQIKIFDGLREVLSGEEGELCARGSGLMSGYWNLPERNEQAFLRDAEGELWYKTGDIVYEEEGNYVYLGRRDRMVKKRGYRIELGEIEAALYRHPAIAEAAVIALSEADGTRIKAFISCNSHERPGLIALKQFCSEQLPSYMIPDLFSLQETLPKTSTDKIDYQKLTLLT